MSKFKIFVICIILCIVAIFSFWLFHKNNINHTTNSKENLESIKNKEDKEDYTEDLNIDHNGATYNGWLKTNGNALENEHGKPIQLRGVSSHSLDWFYDVITYDNLKYLKDNWNINVFRIAIYTDVDGKGYIHSPESTKNKVYSIIDMAVNLDMYVIVDWHILKDNNPQIYKSEAINFFDEVSKKYANTSNVIYEICNEPNGNNVTWDNDIKPYANEVIPVIRNNSKKSLIIVGTPYWCTNIQSAANNTLNFENIVYSCHFYAGSHGDDLRKQIDYCINNNVPIFVSECGLTDASGNGNLFFDKFNEWIDYMNSNNISWVYWSFSNKAESSSILLPNSDETDKLDTVNYDIENSLTTAGDFIEKVFQNYDGNY